MKSNEKSRTLQSRIVSGSIVLLSGSSLATAVNLAYNFTVARSLGPRGFGHATALYTLLTIISAVTLSFQLVSAKAVAQQTSEAEKDAVYKDLHRAAWVCGVVVAMILLLFRSSITSYLNLPSSLLVVLLAVGALFYVPLGSRRGYIQGAFGFRRLATNLVLEGTVRLLGSLLVIALGFGVTGVIAANALAMAAAYFAITPSRSPRTANPLDFSKGLREISQAMIFFTGQVLINNCDIVLVKHFFASREAGLYAVVAMVGRVIFAFSSAVVNSMIPVVAGTRETERKSLSLVTTALLMVLIIGSVLALGLRLTPAWVWPKFFGAGFELAGPHGFPYLLALYAITSVIYSLSVVIITYEMSYKIANASLIQLFFSVVIVAGICRFHQSLDQVIMVQLVLTTGLLGMVAVPFLLNSLRNKGLVNRPPRAVQLIRRISEEEAISEFLKSDFENEAYEAYRDSLGVLVSSPDLSNQGDCEKRKALLFLRHRSLWKELPLGTEWYRAKLDDAALEIVKVFPRAQWLGIAMGNLGITQVAQRLRKWENTNKNPFVTKIDTIRQRLSRDGSLPGSILLIGLSEIEPLTVLDGNHRLVAAMLEGDLDKIHIICGLSPQMRRCCWYKTNLFTLTRYTRNLIKHLPRHPETELERLFENT